MKFSRITKWPVFNVGMIQMNLGVRAEFISNFIQEPVRKMKEFILAYWGHILSHLCLWFLSKREGMTFYYLKLKTAFEKAAARG